MPSVDAVRPARCPQCGIASRPAGGCLRIHGDGLRERQVLGPPGPGEAPKMVLLQVRRYQCQECRAVITVVPREVLARRLYSASAIGFALALWGLMQMAASAVRQRVNPATMVGATAASGWAMLRRWTKDVARGRLFLSVPDSKPGGTLRSIAAAAASALAASAPPDSRALPMAERAFWGAAHVS